MFLLCLSQPFLLLIAFLEPSCTISHYCIVDLTTSNTTKPPATNKQNFLKKKEYQYVWIFLEKEFLTRLGYLMKFDWFV